eukprot:1103819-Pyramimonas_sp.AAC.1
MASARCRGGAGTHGAALTVGCSGLVWIRWPGAACTLKAHPGVVYSFRCPTTQRHRDTETVRHRQTQRHRDTETETQRHSQRQSETDTETQTATQRHSTASEAELLSRALSGLG